MAGDGGGWKIPPALTERQRPHSSLQRMVTELSFRWTMEPLQQGLHRGGVPVPSGHRTFLCPQAKLGAHSSRRSLGLRARPGHTTCPQALLALHTWHCRHQKHKNFRRSQAQQKAGLEGHQAPQKGEQPRIPKGWSQQCFQSSPGPLLPPWETCRTIIAMKRSCPSALFPKAPAQEQQSRQRKLFSKHKLKSY